MMMRPGRAWAARVLALLLVPVVSISLSARPAAATVVAVGQTVTGVAQTPGNTFPGGAVYCQVTGYTRLHDTGLYSIRAVVNCDWGFSYSATYEPEQMRLVVTDAEGSEKCRFENIGSPIVENEPSETTLTANLHPTTPPDPSCVLTSATLYLQAGPSPASPDGAEYDLQFGWALGKLPDPPAQPSGTGSCPGEYTMSTPIVGEPFVWKAGDNRFVADGTPASTQTNRRWVQRVTVTITRPSGPSTIQRRPSLQVIGQGVTASKTHAQLQADASALYGASYSTGLNLYGSSSSTETLRIPEGSTLFTNSSGGNVMHKRAVSLAAPEPGVTQELPDSNSSAWNSAITVTLYFFTSFVQSPAVSGSNAVPPQDLRIIGVQFQQGARTTNSTSAENAGYSGYNRVGANGLCWMYFGEKVRTDNFYGATSGDPVGPLATGSPSDPVTEGPLEGPDPVSTDDGQCDGFSFTDPTSWAGAGICVLVKAVRALFGVMGDVLDAVLGLVGQLGSLLQTLFIPDPSSWDLDGTVEAFQDRPPGSLVVGVTEAVTEASDAYTNAGGGCSEFVSWPVKGKPAESVSCAEVSSIAGYSGLRQGVQVGLWIFTGLVVLFMLRQAVRGTAS